MNKVTHPLEHVLGWLKASGEETRLRILALLMHGELSVTDLTDILAQSQPRISRHLKLLADVGLVERHREGAWAFYRLPSAQTAAHDYLHLLSEQLDCDCEPLITDVNRMYEVRALRAQAALTYFNREAENWDHIRSLYAPDEQVESTLLSLIKATFKDRKIGALLDLGTGTGRILNLLAPHSDQAVGMDASPAMLKVARANILNSELTHVELRQADLYALPNEGRRYDLIVMHQVLHHLDDPLRAIKQAAQLLSVGGYLMVVDFAPHHLEVLREKHAHQRLGFSQSQMQDWFNEVALNGVKHIDLCPPHTTTDHLTVSIWLAQDKRVLFDGVLPDVHTQLNFGVA